MNAQELAAIRERDARYGPNGAMQDRRALLAHIDALTAKVTNYLRSVDGRCIDVACPSQHVDAGQDCIDFHLAILRGEA